MGLIKLDIISTVVQRSVTGRPVPTGNTIIMQGGTDIDNIIDKITADLRDKYLSKTTDDEALGMINFKPGLKIGGIELKYDEENNAVFIERSDGNPVNFYATGGLSMYGLGNTKVTSIMDVIKANIDPNTLGMVNGKLTVIGGGGSGGEGGITAVTKQMVIDALGFTPYSAENPNGYITAASIPSALKNPYALTFGSKTYDGSSAKEITASDLGAALSGDLAKYLPLSGGTISGQTAYPLTINSNSGGSVASYMQFSHKNVVKSAVGYWGNRTTIQDAESSSYLAINSDGVFYNTNKIWHSGNDGSESGLDADLLDGKHLSQIFANRIAVADISEVGDIGLYHVKDKAINFKVANGYLLNFKYGSIALQLNASHNGKIYARSVWYANTYNWNQLAYITDNVASATKLQTARTIWGQSFDGSGNVSGDLNGVGRIIRTESSAVDMDWAGNFIFKNPNSVAANYWHIDTSDGTPIFVVHNNGNVGIGTTSPKSRLHIVGNIFLTGNHGGAALYAGLRSDEALSIEIIGTNGNWVGKGITLLNNGYVGIGTQSPSAKLHVVGNILATGGVTMQSARILKNVVDERGLSLTDLSAIKPTRYTWKDKRDDRLHFGGIADDIEKVLPEVIYKTSDGTLTMDYGNAGFAIASSLIKPVIDHEERIKALEKENEMLKQELNRLRA